MEMYCKKGAAAVSLVGPEPLCGLGAMFFKGEIRKEVEEKRSQLFWKEN